MQKITLKEFQSFLEDYITNQYTTYKNLRFGQAFISKYFPKETDPELFYEVNDAKAVAKIIKKYTDYSLDNK